MLFTIYDQYNVNLSADTMDGSDVKEGFICPVCMKNLHGVAELQSHFNSSHQQEDKLIKQSLRGWCLHGHRNVWNVVGARCRAQYLMPLMALW